MPETERKCKCGAWAEPDCQHDQCRENFWLALIQNRMPPKKLQVELWGVYRTIGDWQKYLRERHGQRRRA